MWRVVAVVCGMVIIMAGGRDRRSRRAAAVHAQRVHEVRRVSGVAAFWDFVTREPGSGRFVAHTARPDEVAYPLAVHTRKDAGRLGNRILREAGVE